MARAVISLSSVFASQNVQAIHRREGKGSTATRTADMGRRSGLLLSTVLVAASQVSDSRTELLKSKNVIHLLCFLSSSPLSIYFHFLYKLSVLAVLPIIWYFLFARISEEIRRKQGKKWQGGKEKRKEKKNSDMIILKAPFSRCWFCQTQLIFHSRLFDIGLQRLDNYYKRNYKDYFEFVEGSLSRKEELSESEKGILEWLQKNK